MSDAGPGIAGNAVDRIFDRFYRGDPSRARKRGGSGLGLAIAKSIVVAHGGSIDVTSTEARGSTFTVELPAASKA